METRHSLIKTETSTKVNHNCATGYSTLTDYESQTKDWPKVKNTTSIIMRITRITVNKNSGLKSYFQSKAKYSMTNRSSKVISEIEIFSATTLTRITPSDENYLLPNAN